MPTSFLGEEAEPQIKVTQQAENKVVWAFSGGESEICKSLNGIIKGQGPSFFNPPRGLGKCSQAKLLPGTKELKELPSSSAAFLLSVGPPLENRQETPQRTPWASGPPRPLTPQPVIDCKDHRHWRHLTAQEGFRGGRESNHVNEGIPSGTWAQTCP